MKRLLHDPLIHFLAIGALLFGFYWFTADQAVSETNNRITLGAGEIEQMRAIFVRQRQRPPTEEELNGLIHARVYEEVLYREALAMGLDKDDTIIKRRLTQKFEFLMEDLTDLGNPSEAELAAFFKQHGDRYQVPGRLSFVHVYFSNANRGKSAEHEAKRDLARLRNGAPPAAAEEMGDSFLLERAYKQIMPEEIDKIFGPGFAAQLAKAPLREWQGPIASGYGLHLVRIDEHEAPRASALDPVREQVKRDWLDGRRQQLKETAFKKFRERYEIVVDDNALRAALVAHRGSVQESNQ
jgi:hypothetical protein